MVKRSNMGSTTFCFTGSVSTWKVSFNRGILLSSVCEIRYVGCIIWRRKVMEIRQASYNMLGAGWTLGCRPYIQLAYRRLGLPSFKATSYPGKICLDYVPQSYRTLATKLPKSLVNSNQVISSLVSYPPTGLPAAFTHQAHPVHSSSLLPKSPLRKTGHRPQPPSPQPSSPPPPLEHFLLDADSIVH